MYIGEKSTDGVTCEISDLGVKLDRAKLNDKEICCFKMEDLMDHPALFAKYPELKRVEVNTTLLNANSADSFVEGGWSPKDHCVNLSYGDHNTDKEILSTLLHESQHMIQQIEGWDLGSNVHQWDLAAKSLVDDYKSDGRKVVQQLIENPTLTEDDRIKLKASFVYLRDAQAGLDVAIRAGVIDEHLTPGNIPTYVRNQSEAGEYLKRKQIDQAITCVKYALYRADPGEVQARNTGESVLDQDPIKLDFNVRDFDKAPQESRMGKIEVAISNCKFALHRIYEQTKNYAFEKFSDMRSAIDKVFERDEQHLKDGPLVGVERQNSKVEAFLAITAAASSMAAENNIVIYQDRERAQRVQMAAASKTPKLDVAIKEMGCKECAIKQSSGAEYIASRDATSSKIHPNPALEGGRQVVDRLMER